MTERKVYRHNERNQTMIEWIRSWWITFQLWWHDRGTYRFLANYRHDPDEFVDAPRPT